MIRGRSAEIRAGVGVVGVVRRLPPPATTYAINPGCVFGLKFAVCRLATLKT